MCEWTLTLCWTRWSSPLHVVDDAERGNWRLTVEFWDVAGLTSSRLPMHEYGGGITVLACKMQWGGSYYFFHILKELLGRWRNRGWFFHHPLDFALRLYVHLLFSMFLLCFVLRTCNKHTYYYYDFSFSDGFSVFA